MIDTGSAVDLFDPDSDERMIRKIPTELYSRVAGYFRPVQNWNKGKQQEFGERKVYDLKKVFAHPEPTIEKSNPLFVGS